VKSREALTHTMSLISNLIICMVIAPLLLLSPSSSCYGGGGDCSYVMQTSAMKGQMSHLKETLRAERESEWTREIDLNLLTAGKHILHKFLTLPTSANAISTFAKTQTGKGLAAVNWYFWSVWSASPSKTHHTHTLSSQKESFPFGFRNVRRCSIIYPANIPTSRFIPLKWSQLVWLGKHFAN